MLLLLACMSDPAPAVDPAATTPTAEATTAASTGATTAAVCAESDAFIPIYADTLATWSAQDALGGWPADAVVFVGSSTMRRWETLSDTFFDYAPIQRGFGGAQLGEVAQAANALVNVHHPRGVVVYAGANDVAAGVDAATVLGRFRCLRARIPASTPVLSIAITPNPARWSTWDVAAEVNAGVAALATADPSIVYLDVATPFLATGSPPDASLFVSDGLHLSESGYALWTGVVRPGVEAALAPAAISTATALPAGTRILIDLGPQDATTGEAAASPDYLGQTWNNWFVRAGGDAVLPGEQLVNLLTTAGEPTDVDLVLGGGFSLGGRADGGLLWPDAALLDDLAVGSATGDWFALTGNGTDQPGAFFLRGLDPVASYTLRMFGAREDAEVRSTTFTVNGSSVTLQTSGAGAGHDGGTVNDDDVATFTGLRPTSWGTLWVDATVAQGSEGYLSLVALTVE